MSDSEEENFCFFGKPLEPYDEDTFPKKKPVSVEDQIATDAQGRRRFHGAFTGGFSAGFFNTVGSLEGWTPSEFKSTRQDKAKNKQQQPQDFMDDEDMGEFGIAPQTVRATKDYSTSKKRKRQTYDGGPIPGEPVLHSLLSSGNETIGYLLLKNIGLQDRKQAEDQETLNEDDEGEITEKVYGCEMPKTYEIKRHADIDEYPIDAIYKEYLAKPKSNSFGLGYSGLDKSHINLFQPQKLVIREKNKKKLSIAGQAFGVGAFEDDDDDIYLKEDMSKYDFELTSEKKTNKEASLSKNEKIHLDEFIRARKPLQLREIFTPPTIPHSFTGKHKVKKSRFEPIASETSAPEEKSLERKNMNPAVRAKYLGEEPAQQQRAKSPEIPAEEIKNEPISPTDQKPTSDFLLNSGLVFDRFVSASKPEDTNNILEEVTKAETEHGTKEMRDAAKMKLFGPLTRITSDWQPASLLCRRFNVPEPHLELNASRNRKRTKNLIFQYEEHKDDAPDLRPGLTTFNNQSENGADADLNSTKESNEASSADVSENNAETAENENKVKEIVVEKAPIDFTDRIDARKNIDLFKAVFLSDSEEEEAEEEQKVEEKKEEPIKKSTNDDNVHKINILSNILLPTIKPMKEGILSHVNFNNTQSKEEKSDCGKVAEEPKIDPNAYGPSLPQMNPLKRPAPVNETPADASSSSSCDEWIELDKKSDKEPTKKERTLKKKKSKKHKHKKSSHHHKGKKSKRKKSR